ncbi:MAG: serine/threonine protein kinase, partial [Planctomycetaceae bacterium]|nr:serine/threonine protein kinase [Planctomycetaceae bacterium]
MSHFLSICPKCGAAINTDGAAINTDGSEINADSSAIKSDGAEINADTSGLCPVCLLQLAAEPTGDFVSDLNAIDASRISGNDHHEPQTFESEIDIATVRNAFGQLEILEQIGRGGMGTVFKARQPALDRFVALKILSVQLAEKPTFAERFAQEGKLLARLAHPNIVAVYDFGQTETTDEAGNKLMLFFLLLEYVEGVNLRQAMREERFTPEQALAIVPKICDALQYAHDEGVLHRDIKPENILLDTKGRVKIADFGIAKLKRSATADDVDGHGERVLPLTQNSLTQTGQILGTPSYMAPEQRNDPNRVDHRADIYSLGVVFYELLTGELPHGRFPMPSEKAPVGADIDNVVLKAMHSEREKRQQSAEELKTEIHTAAHVQERSLQVEQEWELQVSVKKPPCVRLILAMLVLCSSLFTAVWFPVSWIQSRAPIRELQTKQMLFDLKLLYWQSQYDFMKKDYNPANYKGKLPDEFIADFDGIYQNHLRKVQDVRESLFPEKEALDYELHQQTQKVECVRGYYGISITHPEKSTFWTLLKKTPYLSLFRWSLTGFLLSGALALWCMFRSGKSKSKRGIVLASVAAILSSTMLLILPVVFAWLTQSTLGNPNYLSYMFDGEIWGLFFVIGIAYYVMTLLLVYTCFIRNGQKMKMLRRRALLALCLVLLPGTTIPFSFYCIEKTPIYLNYYFQVHVVEKEDQPQSEALMAEFLAEYDTLLEKHQLELPEHNKYLPDEHGHGYYTPPKSQQDEFQLLRAQLTLPYQVAAQRTYGIRSWMPPQQYMTDARTIGASFTVSQLVLVLLPGLILAIIHLVMIRRQSTREGLYLACAAIFFWPTVITILSGAMVAYLLFIEETSNQPDFMPLVFITLVGMTFVVGGNFVVWRLFKSIRTLRRVAKTDHVVPVIVRKQSKSPQLKTEIHTATNTSSSSSPTNNLSLTEKDKTMSIPQTPKPSYRWILWLGLLLLVVLSLVSLAGIIAFMQLDAVGIGLIVGLMLTAAFVAAVILLVILLVKWASRASASRTPVMPTKFCTHCGAE